MLVEFLNVQTASALVHVHTGVYWAFDLNCSPVSLLSVQFAAVSTLGRFNRHNFSLVVASSIVIRSGNDSLPGWVEPKVSLVHQLLVERGVDGGIVV